MDVKQFAEKTVQETQELLQQELDGFIEKVKGIKDLDELNKLEQEVDAEQEEFDAYLKEAKYPLVDEPIDFEGKKYRLRDISTKIIYYINRIEQSFQYVLGLHGVVRFWKNTTLTEIPYGLYDSTLRLLGQINYRGDQEWTDILAINNYLAKVHDPYFKDQSILTMLAQKRNAVLNQIEMNKPQAPAAEA